MQPQTPAIRPRRSVLYMPGSNARALEKARTLPADAVILDLEDSVAPEAKETARAQVAAAVAAGGFGGREVVVRVNGLDSPWAEADIAAAAAAGPDAVLVPKVSGPQALERVALLLDAAGAPDTLAVWAMIETPRAILDLDAIAGAGGDTRLACLVLGLNDLAKETRARFVPGRAPMLPWIVAALTAARAHGLDVIDGVYNRLDDADGFLAECEQGRDLGLDGKTLIHPGQIATANAVFAPSVAEVDEARTIAALFEHPDNAGKGAVAHNGRMVERLHADMARRVVALADAIAARA